LRQRLPRTAQRGGVGRRAVAPGRAQQRVGQRIIGHFPGGIDAAPEGMAERVEHLALHTVPAHAGPAPAGRQRRQTHIAGPDSAYSTEATSRVLGGSIQSAISTPTATSRATNGTRSERGPVPPPLKLE